MSRIRWVPRQNKLETPKEKDEVNKREVHECHGRGNPNSFLFIESIVRGEDKTQIVCL